ncbi:hypothetical protein [uncultured Sphingomonas sp.]|uniref:hypothetical protein n=1 Tax=uncultured Sphingomonas sp. TaxID=158754 RepID=UPI0035CB11FE
MRARRIGLVVLALLAAVLAGGWRYVQGKRPQLELGVGYAARVACGCRYMGNRPLTSCYKDFEPGMAPIRLKEDAGAKAITAYVPLIAHRTVRFDPVLGCQPEPFRGRRLPLR